MFEEKRRYFLKEKKKKKIKVFAHVKVFVPCGSIHPVYTPGLVFSRTFDGEGLFK